MVSRTRFGKCHHSRKHLLSNVPLRDFVASFWPNAGTPGANIRSMYERIVSVKPEPDASRGNKVNGQANGVMVKEE